MSHRLRMKHSRKHETFCGCVETLSTQPLVGISFLLAAASSLPNWRVVMRHNRLVKGAVYRSLSVAAIAASLATVGTAAAQTAYPTQQRHLLDDLAICDFGAFFVGGVPKLTKYANST